MRWLEVLGIVVLSAACGGAVAGEAASACVASPKLVGACFAVHGRLSAWNGAPTFRIARLDTKRVLGVGAADGDPAGGLPASVETLVSPDAFKVDVVGDFRVCPLAPRRPGRMQMVCIAKASGLAAHRR